MAGTAAPNLLIPAPARTTFVLAGPADDADLRRLLRDNPMPGATAISLEREPSFFLAAGLEGDEHQTVICRNEAGVAIGMGARAVRTTHGGDAVERTGYLSQLRLAHAARGSFHLITRGYRLLQEMHERDGQTRVYLTSIMEENAPARQFLEAGLRGLPTYHPLDRFETSILNRAAATVPTGTHLRQAQPGDEDAVAALLHTCNRTFAFAQVWDQRRMAALAPMGLTIDRFVIAEHRGTPVACAAVWDQRSFKQSVVRAYSPALTFTRPVINAVGRMLGWPDLPPSGQPMPIQFLSHTAAIPGHQAAFASVVADACARCRREGCCLVAGFAARHPLAPVLGAFRRRMIPSILYAVAWPDGVAQAATLRDRTVHSEVSLL